MGRASGGLLECPEAHRTALVVVLGGWLVVGDGGGGGCDGCDGGDRPPIVFPNPNCNVVGSMIGYY